MSPYGRVSRSYYAISGAYTLSASLIWGVNTLFLLDAGLDIFGVFVANGAFTAAMVVFEVPTGILADTRGRRVSFLSSNVVLLVSTLGYVAVAEGGAGLLAFCLVSVVMGLGFTLYSGAVEAWVVDALRATGYEGTLDKLFANGAIVTGSAMLVGTVGGGVLGSIDLSLPFFVRSGLIVVSLALAVVLMRDVGFTPRRVTIRGLGAEMRAIGRAGIAWGWREPQIRLLVTASFVQFGFLMWGWYAWQPYLLDLLHSEQVWVAGAIAAANSLATIAGNTIVDVFTRFCGKRTTLLLIGSVVQTAAIISIGLAPSFTVALVALLVVMASIGVIGPVKQAYLHQVVPGEHRATLVSIDSMVGNAGGIAAQTGLGALARSMSIPAGYVVGGIATVIAVPVFWALRRRGEVADRIVGKATKRGPCAGQGLPDAAAVDTKPRRSTEHAGAASGTG
jgi:MFS family permease